MTAPRTAALSTVLTCAETLDDRLEALGASGPADIGPLVSVMADAHAAVDAALVLAVAVRLTGAKPTELQLVVIDRHGPAVWLRTGPTMVVSEVGGALHMAPVGAKAPTGGAGQRPSRPVWPADMPAPGHGPDGVTYQLTADLETATGVRMRLAEIDGEMVAVQRRLDESITVEAADLAEADLHRLAREQTVLTRRLASLGQAEKDAALRKSIADDKAEDARRAVELPPLQEQLASVATQIATTALPKPKRRWGRR